MMANIDLLTYLRSYSKLTINSLDICEEVQDEKDQGLKSSSNSRNVSQSFCVQKICAISDITL